MTRYPTPTTVAAALRAVVSGESVPSSAWALIGRVIQAEVRACRMQRDGDDVQQEVCIKFLGAQNVTAETDAAAKAYIRTVTYRVIIDRTRRDKVRPQAVPWREGNDPLDRVATDDVEIRSIESIEAATEALLDRVLAEVDRLIEESGKPAAMRELNRNQAHARVLSRLFGKSTAEIAAELGVPDATNACVQKWVERGLPLLVQALDAVASGTTVGNEPDDRQLLDKLRHAISKRRTDAGKTRETRRKPSKGAK